MEISPQDASSSHHPVTYIVRRRVKADRQTDFEDWLKASIAPLSDLTDTLASM